MTKLIYSLALYLGLSASLWAGVRETQEKTLKRASLGLIPYPNYIALKSGSYKLPQHLILGADDKGFDFALHQLENILGDYPHIHTQRLSKATEQPKGEAVSTPTRQSQTPPKSKGEQAKERLLRLAEGVQQGINNIVERYVETSDEADIQLSYRADIPSTEGYEISISPQGILLEAKAPQGMLYAVISLGQILESHYNRRLEQFDALECLHIVDSPRYPLRGLMLDPARHFLPKEAVMRYIDEMMRYKFNTLQLHLTDDQGWRIEIKKHPKLTQTTATRGQGSESQTKASKLKRAYTGYYTQEDIKELIAYANERGISIIPEIDIPGHTAALLATYPELRMEDQLDSIYRLGKVDNVMLSAVNEKTYSILADIFTEIATLFPRGTRIHLGGDESAIARNWGKSPSHLALMQAKGYTKPEQLMDYFFGRVYKIIEDLGLRPMQWCELDNIRMPAHNYLMDYPQDVTLITWRMGLTPKCIDLTRGSGHKLILAPGESAYLDYPQWQGDLPEHNNWGMPITTLEQSYNFDLKGLNITKKDEGHIMGVMATLWGEAIPDINRAFYMTYPRALAIAEQGWTEYNSRSWTGFKASLPYVLNALERRGIAHRRPVELYRR